jgi:hypothetical protein
MLTAFGVALVNSSCGRTLLRRCSQPATTAAISKRLATLTINHKKMLSMAGYRQRCRKS